MSYLRHVFILRDSLSVFAAAGFGICRPGRSKCSADLFLRYAAFPASPPAKGRTTVSHPSPQSGRKIVAHGASRGRMGPPPPREPRQGRKKSRPNVALIVGDAILLEKGDQFLLKGDAAVMLLLIADISHNRWRQRMADTECSIASLPVESGKTPAAVEPA